MNIVTRARTAMKLSRAAFAKLLDINPSSLSRWETSDTEKKLPGAVIAAMKLIIDDPRRASDVLCGVGYAGDGGPPPRRGYPQYSGDPVDEHGFVIASGGPREESIGFSPSELELPEHGLDLDADDPNADPNAVPGFSPEFGPD